MRLHRFYTTEELAPGKQITIDSAELCNQVRRVFRLKTGDEIILFNGTGFDYLVKIANYNDSGKMTHDNSMVVDIDTAPPTRSRFQPDRKVFLYAAVVKKDTFEWIVEKATELGVTDIIPVMAERSEKKNLNEERLKKISIEASEQSGRGDVPVIHSIISLEDSVAQVASGNKIQTVVFHIDGEKFSRDSISKNEPVACFIGPEGGWSEREVELFHKNGLQMRSLGTQVLRAETAVIAALSQVVF
ncbi:MAG: RsmE family RNA methyltransferase [Patescibacteria group bacterium]